MTHNANLTSLTMNELEKEYSATYTSFAIKKSQHKNKLATLELHSDAFITITKEMIVKTQAQVSLYEEYDVRLKNHEQYEDEGARVQTSLNGQLDRGRAYLAELESQLSNAQKLAHLYSLTTDELVEEAKQNKPSAELISKTPDLIAKIPTSQIPMMTHQDPELTQSLTTAMLTQKDYTTETATTYAALDTGANSDTEKAMIAAAENKAIAKLLAKMNEYLEKKIADANTKNTSPWALGYFGSGYKLTKDDKKTAVPQGIYDIKNHLAQIATVPPKQILQNIQQIITAKLGENKDESILAQFKRFVSWMFGYARSQETVKEYGDLNVMCLGSN